MTKKPSQSTTTTPNIYQKLHLIQAQIKELIRTERNTHQNYFFFNELQVLQLLKPLLEKYKLTILLSDDDNKEFTCEQLGKMYFVKYGKKCLVVDSENPTEQLTFYFWAPGLNQDPAKAKGSAETYAVKYFLSKLFLIPVKDEGDPDYRKMEETEKKENKPASSSHNLEQSATELANPTNDESPLTKKPKKTEFTPQARVVITNIKTKFDKNNNQYLLLETDTLANNVFVFPYKVADSRWPELSKDKTYQFNLEESENGLLVLVDFSEVN
jgi:ERF superfamily